MSNYETLYRGKHVVKHKKENGLTVETYVEFEEGQVYLNTYVNFKLYSRTHVADLCNNSELLNNASKDIAADAAQSGLAPAMENFELMGG